MSQYNQVCKDMRCSYIANELVGVNTDFVTGERNAKFRLQNTNLSLLINILITADNNSMHGIFTACLGYFACITCSQIPDTKQTITGL